MVCRLPCYDGSTISFCNRWKVVANDPIVRSLNDRVARIIMFGYRWTIVFIDLVLRWVQRLFKLSYFTIVEWSFVTNPFTIAESSFSKSWYYSIHDPFLGPLNNHFYRSCFAIVQSLFWNLQFYFRSMIICNEPFSRSSNYRFQLVSNNRSTTPSSDRRTLILIELVLRSFNYCL